MKIWDTVGAERFHCLTCSFFKKADAIIMCFDITDANTFTNIENWMATIDTHCQQNVPRVLLGMKVDLDGDRTVSRFEAEKYA